MQQDWLHLGGNHERQLLDRPVERMSATDSHTRQRLSQGSLDWVAAQKPVHRIDDEVFLYHASPRSDLEYLLKTVTPQGIRLAFADEIAERRGDIPAQQIACGHNHLPSALRAADGCLLLNPGSVGLPGYDDEHPFFHWVDNGSPDARCAVAEQDAAATGRPSFWPCPMTTLPWWPWPARTGAKTGLCRWRRLRPA